MKSYIMYKIRTIVLFSVFLLSLASVRAQEKKYEIGGYIKNMEGLFFLAEPESQILNTSILDYNLTHQRFQFDYFFSNNLTATVHVRNRLYIGNMIRKIPPFSMITEKDNGRVDMSWNIANGDSWFLNTSIDRLFLDYTYGEWNITLGRQRINWGINLVWNPNDLFNNYNYLDFDYEERPGADAVKLTRYFGYTSSMELAYKMGDNIESRALAAAYRFNTKGYDIQLLGGWKGYDLVIGGGWSGDIKGAGFRGEITYFYPMSGYKEKSDQATVASISLDYTFSNGLYLQTSGLYNSQGTTGDISSQNILYMDSDLSAKQLSLGRYEWFGQFNYTVSPIVQVSCSSIMNVCDTSGYVGPSVTFSLSDDLELMTMGQLFWGKALTEYGTAPNSVYLRLKYSF